MNKILKKLAEDQFNQSLQQGLSQNDSSSQVLDPYGTRQEDNNQVDPKIVQEVTQLLDRILESANSLKDIYYVLFDNLSALYSTYPSIYQQLQMTVKLPQNQDAMDIVTLRNNLDQSIQKFKDPIYLQSYLKNQSETI